ncbi:arsenate reductase ArsC [Fusibacter sp. 3D3]|uniref:arsenate reductase ArsC n=1 Tax=Fusibacter sp. 3D3 TaxID=1048380 RepID=UPI0008535DFB|nr:arsenate reductase ArsC [Fusibacter sp. 3D3]GAU76512.1 arsenate reductase [Fusibacter sp. 3D3]
MKPVKILFVCVHNSARSQMAEAFLNDYGAAFAIAESAGIEKGTLNPLAVKVMDEIGIDISKNEVNSVFEFFKNHKLYTYVVTVCDESSGQKCPIFPGVREMIHWSLDDPSSFEGTEEERLEKTRVVRDQIKANVLGLIEDLKSKYNLD